MFIPDLEVPCLLGAAVEVLGLLAFPDLLDLPDVDAAVEAVLAGEGPLPHYQHQLPANESSTK